MRNKPNNPELDPNVKYRVYRNLTDKTLSIMDTRTKKVVGHTSKILLREVKFIVSKRGVERIRESRRKQVVAFAEGYFVNYFGLGAEGPTEFKDWESKYADSEAIYFNPYKYDTFVNAIQEPIFYKEYVQISDDGWIYGWNKPDSNFRVWAKYEHQKELATKPIKLMTGFAVDTDKPWFFYV